MMKPSCLIRVPSSLESGTFFHWWVRFLNPFHDLTSREMEVTAEFLTLRYELSKKISDPILLDKLAIDTDARNRIKSKLRLKSGYINLIISKLRKCGIVKGDALNPRFMPDVEYDGGKPRFSVLLYFDFKDDEGPEAQVK